MWYFGTSGSVCSKIYINTAQKTDDEIWAARKCYVKHFIPSIVMMEKHRFCYITN